ncbi:MAG: hypothetical protein AB1778_02040 [Candidatus Bipolaricaulota bacterium]
MSRHALWVGFVAAGLLLVAGRSGAEPAEGVGTLFRLGTSARSLGWGGVSAAVADGVGALANPAALGRIETLGVSSLYASGFGGTSYGALDFAAPLVALSAVFLDSGAIPLGAGALRFTSYGLVGSVGLPIGPVGVGVRWRFLRVAQPFVGHGWALDPGLLVDLGRLRLGLIWEAAASAPMVYEGSVRSDAWTPDLVLGAAWTVSPAEDVVWTAAADLRGALRGRTTLVGGMEAWIGGLGARVGWDGSGPTFGLSAVLSWLRVDWSTSVRSDLGASHRISLGVAF